MNLFVSTVVFSALAFVGYGFSCLLARHMVREFQRYGLARFRVLTGALQLAAATGLLVGLWLPAVGAAASGGLAVQMLLGVGVRRRIRDTWLQTLPALFFCLISAWMFVEFLGRARHG